MATAHDVAAYILRKHGRMSAMKLEKLVYYCQAWSLVWDDIALFTERIEAWANGPVVPDLFEKHRGMFDVADWLSGDPDALDQDGRETVDAVLDYYAPHSAQWLSDVTHAEPPWRLARIGLSDGERGNNEITLESMAEYYGSLERDGKVA
jgi:uncharacterized phage-associated protein